MSNIQLGLLRLITSVILLFLSSCAAASGPARGIPNSVPHEQRLTIDLSGGTATTEDWTSDIVDCSDREYFCILIPNRMALAFVRACTSASRDELPPTRFGSLLRVAPAPHLAAPSGSYIIREFPNVLLFYRVSNNSVEGQGLVEARIIRNSPSEEAFDPSNYIANFRIVTPDGGGLFVCS